MVVDANSSLMEAAKAGEYEQARLMLNRGADVNHKDANGWTPLHWASRFRSSMTKGQNSW